jgi:hypothetical protein
LVVVRVQAFNAYGQGLPSPVNVPSENAARIANIPLTISEAPVYVDGSINSMTIAWQAVPQY